MSTMDEWEKKMQEWPSTEAYQMLQRTGLRYDGRVTRCLCTGFGRGEIDGTLENLERVVLGEIYLLALGAKARMLIAMGLIEWYKTLSLPHSPASTSRPGDPRQDERTVDGRSEEGEG